MKNLPSCSSVDDNDGDEEGYSGSTRWWRSDPDSGSGAASGGPSARERVVRELDRLASAGGDHNGLSELRHKLITYRCGDFWVPTGGIPKEGTDIPPVATLLLVGLSGAGKTSLVNFMYSVLGRSCLASSGKHTTSMFLEEHNVIRSLRSGFCVYDSRGFDYDQPGELVEEELFNWINDGVHHNQLCVRAGDRYSVSRDELDALATSRPSSSKFARRRVNSVMVVVNAAETYAAFKAEKRKRLDALKELYRSPVFKRLIENPILILTHGDTMSSEDRIDARIKICEWLGVSETGGVYDVACRTEHGFAPEDSDPVSAYAVAEAVYRALLVSDRTHLPKRNFFDYAILVLSWLMCFVAALFAFLAQVFAKFGHRDGRLRL